MSSAAIPDVTRRSCSAWDGPMHSYYQLQNPDDMKPERTIDFSSLYHFARISIESRYARYFEMLVID